MLRVRITLLLLPLLVAPALAQNTLYIPETFEGPVYTLNAAPSSHEFFPGVQTDTYGFNGGYLGPTLILQRGAEVQMHVSNQIGESTTVHWHGMHVAAEDDGGPHSVISPGTVWSPDFTVLDRATTFWYHPHLHEHTGEHVYRGLAGMIIVRDGEEALLDLPRTYGVDDIPVVIQDRQFDAQRQLVFNPGGAGQQGNTMVVNGTVDPVLTLGAGVNRLRLLNGSNARVYQLGLSDDSPFFMVGSDGGLLEAPVELQRLRLAPGERAEVLIDLGGRSGESFTLMSYSSELTRGEPGGVALPNQPPPPAGSIDGTDFTIMQIAVVQAQGSPVQTIPQQLSTLVNLPESSADRVRPMRLDTAGPGPAAPLAINGVVFNMAVINEVVNLGDTEIWEIDNVRGGPHPFHIHDVQFRILDRGGVPPPPQEAGWKDVVLVYPGERVRFITQFLDFADPDTPYMYHCHLLGHEDGGMMGQFLVIDPLATAIERPGNGASLQLSAYPDPAVDWSTIAYEVDQRSPVRIEVFDLLGRSVAVLFDGVRDPGPQTSIWKTGQVPPGTYLVRVQAGNRLMTRTLRVRR
ncbi:MAG: multicopper oxidase domain-containing protein [Bacteroidetes bacterium]|nr:multicopper oxidase domain-containing protein [Bacteroidota bacterium]MDA0874251.1 multicopper oxidase domain-containing protein [Bacteroidota bacterium]